MADKPGKFTQQFDTEILKKFLSPTGDDALNREIQEKLAFIEEKLEQRKAFLLERFPNATAMDTEKGMKIVFEKNETFPQKGELEFTFSLNEETHAIHIDYSFILGEGSQKKDYILLALKKFNTDKINNFIESKILQFARIYVQGE